MRILVTGSSGLIGGAISRLMLANGREVVGVHRTRSYGTCGQSEFSELVVDIGSRSEVEKIRDDCRPCDAIIHAAACIDMSPYETQISTANCAGTQNILWLASEWRVSSFIFISSLQVIGAPRFLPITEEHPVEPSTAYHSSKLFGEHLVNMHSLRGRPYKIYRISAPIGVGMPKKRLLHNLIENALGNRPLRIHGNGTRQQNYIDVRDIAEAVELGLRDSTSGLYNIAGRRAISNIELANLCIERCSSSSMVVLGETKDSEEGAQWDVSIERAKSELKFSPSYDIASSIDWIRESLRNKNLGETV